MNKITNYGYIKTVEEKAEVKELLELLRQSMFKKEGFAKALKANVPLKYSPLINLFIKRNVGKEGFEGSLEALGSYLNELNELNLTLAFEPSQEFLDNIYKWVTKNIGQDLILNISVDPKILGGTVISFGGYYLDYSLSKKLDRAFSEKKEEIRKLYE